jgi:hypothetical protein
MAWGGGDIELDYLREHREGIRILWSFSNL